ncbi:MAG TPA: hypothetical protein VHT96_11585 [Clostridia bacterium]|nr:hypothetical protein [Clostridia bacterium]
MKKILIIAAICIIIFIVIISFIQIFNPFDNKTEYPLQLVDIDDNSQYILVKEFSGYEIITDTNLIKENTSNLKVVNNGTLYGTTPDGALLLFKDGKQIDCVWIDGTYTRKIEYGTLKFHKINKIQYMLLTGYEIVEKGEYFSILSNNQNNYFFFFVHGLDLGSADNVYLLDSRDSADELPKLHRTSENVLEFIEYPSDYEGQPTAHWYFRLSDYKLSQMYLDVKDTKDNLIVYPASYMDGGQSRIIIHDMFDKSIGFKEIYGDFPQARDDNFLKTARFSENGELSAEYIGNDGQVHESTFIFK